PPSPPSPDCGNSPGTRFDRGHVRILTRAFSTEQLERLPPSLAERAPRPGAATRLHLLGSWARLVSEVSIPRQAMRVHRRPKSADCLAEWVYSCCSFCSLQKWVALLRS